MHIVQTSQVFSFNSGRARLRYVGYKYCESQWVGLLTESYFFESSMTEIGYISLQAECAVPLDELEKKLLLTAKNHGAHIVLIDYLKSLELKKIGNNKFINSVNIYARCQRFET